LNGWSLRLIATSAIREAWIIILVIPSLYFLVLYPPLWKDIDAVLQLTSRASAVNVLQYPPVYCFISRLPFNLASVMEGHSFHHNLLSKQTPSDLGVYLLIIFQHAALIWSLVYACKAIAGSNSVRLFICASILASMGGLYAQAQTCGSESWSTIATIAIFAAGIDLIKCPKLSAWIIYGVGLFFAVGSRHLNALLIVWLPLTGVLLATIGPQQHSERILRFRMTVIASCLGLFTFGLNSIIAREILIFINEPYRPTIGRTLSDRVSSFLMQLPPDARTALGEKLADEQSDPLLREALRLQATTDLGAAGTGEKLISLFHQQGLPDVEASERSDRLLLAESLAYLETFHPVLIDVILGDIWKGLSANQQRVAISPFLSHLWAANDKIGRPGLWRYLEGYSRLKLDDARQLYAKANSDPYLRLWEWAPFWFSYFAIFCFAAASFFLRAVTISRVLVVCSTLFIGLAMWIANMICVYYIDRYALGLLIPSAIALAFIGSLALPRFSTKGRMGVDFAVQ
jgi:hypothetical protein